jgi:PTH1 family peptidyl-tRNA hydrolase
MFFRATVGLGNPGTAYENTRHNIGFRVLDYFAGNFENSPWKYEKAMGAFVCKMQRPDGNLFLVKANNFMNLSGEPVAKFCSFFKISSAEVVVICDDITLDLGQIKITERSGSAGHNGVKSILQAIGPGFVRFRIGIGKKKHPAMDLADHVLSHFDPEETEILSKKMPNICNGLQLLLDKGILSAMNVVNRSVCKQNLTEQP